MPAQKLSIQQLVFDIRFFQQEGAFQFQNRVSKLYGNKLHQIINDFFEAEAPAEVIVKLSTLQLDLGTVAYDDMEEEIALRLLKALQENFPANEWKKTIGHPVSETNNYVIEPLQTGILQLFETYLSGGVLPWWASPDTPITLQEEAFRKLMIDAPAAVCNLLMQLGQNADVRKRVAWQLSNETIQAIIRVVEPGESGFICEYHHKVGMLQQQTPVVQSEIKSFQTDVWYFILTFLIKEHGSNFSRKEFVKSTLKQIAARYSVSYEKLLLHFNEAIYSHAALLEQAGLVQIIKEIYSKEKNGFNQEPVQHLSTIPDEKKLSLLKYFLQHGSFPDGYTHFGTTGIISLFEALAKRQPAALRAMLTSVAAYTITERLLPEYRAAFEQLVQLLQPSFASRILQHETRLKQMLPAIATRQLSGYVQLIQSTALWLLLAPSAFNYDVFIDDWLALVADKAGVPTDGARKWAQSGAIDVVHFSGPGHAGFLPTSEAGETPASSEIFDGERSLSKVLHYFIATGMYPWWAEAFRGKKPEELLMELYARSATETIRLFQFAGNSTQPADRFLYQFPVSLILNIMGLLPGGQNAVNAYQHILDVYEWMDLPRMNSMILKERFLLKLIWQHYLTNKYSSFNEPVFYMEAIRQLCLLSDTPPDELVSSAAGLMQNYDRNNLEDLLRTVQQFFIYRRSLSVVTRLPDEILISYLKKMMDAESTNHSFSDHAGVSAMEEMLIHTATYFFTHHNLPPCFDQVTGVSARLSLLKSVLMKLWNVNSTALRALLDTYYFQPGMPEKLHSLFEIQDPTEKAILLQLNRLHFKNAVPTGSGKSSEAILSAVLPDVYDGTGFPLLQKYYLGNTALDRMEAGRKVVELLDYFLTWQVFKESHAGIQDHLPVTEILKETLQFLYVHNKGALTALLLKNTHLTSARMQLYGLFAKPADHRESQIAHFLKEYLQSDLLNHFYTSGNLKAPPETTAIIIGGQPDSQIVIAEFSKEGKISIDEGSLIQQAADIMMYFLTYNRLPEDVNPVHSKTDVFLKAVFRLLFNSNTAALKSLLNRQTNHPEAKMRLYEWFENSLLPEDKHILSFTHEMRQDDFIAYLRYKLDAGRFEEGNTTAQLLHVITNMQGPELKQVLTIVIAYPAGIKMFVEYYKKQDVYRLLEKADKTWAAAYLNTFHGLRLMFERTLNDSSYLPLVITLLQQFSLLSFSGKIAVGDPHLFITRFFAYADEQLPVLTPDMYRHLQHFRLHTAGITLFATPAVSMHFQQEIAQRLLYSAVQMPYSAEPANQSVPGTKAAVADIAKINKEEVKATAPQNRSSDTQLTTADETFFTGNGKPDAVDRMNNTNAGRIAPDSNIRKEAAVIPLTEKKLLPQNSTPEKASETKGTKIYIQNAGLVLFHPFIQTLFAHTGLTKEKQFMDEESVFKAIHLLQYLVDGSTDHEEHLLPLNKIICNVPLTEPVPKTVPLKREETDLCASLIEMIFQRWNEMKNSSVEGFRHAFLQRSGILMRMDDNWTLRVEQRSYDVLLQTLPWAYGMIRLPWMKDFLYVEWI